MPSESTAFVATGAATGAWVSLNIGGMGLAFSGTAVGLGLAPITATGAIAVLEDSSATIWRGSLHKDAFIIANSCSLPF
jgi:hypothetical protein